MAAIILLLIGSALTCVSAATVWHGVKLHLTGARVSGVLVSWRYSYHLQWLGNGRILRSRHFYPVVRFETPDGTHHDVVSELAFEEEAPPWPFGRPFEVRYDPANPRDATIDPLAPTWIFPAIFLIAGGVILWASISPLLSGP